MISDVVREIHDLNVEAQLDHNLAVWERDIIRDLSSRAQIALGGLERIEVSLKENEGGNPGIETIRKTFNKTIVGLQAIPAALATLPTGVSLGRGITDRLNTIWGAALAAFDEFIRPQKEQLGIDSWSLGASGGFPFGISATFTITFK